MEHLLESKFMIKLQEFGQKLGQNKFLTALQAAMMSLMGIIMVGAIFQILSSVGSESMLNLFSTKSKIYSILYLPYQFTMNSLSLWVVAILAYNYAKNLK
jgi:Phosphotransferase system, EIIC.